MVRSPATALLVDKGNHRHFMAKEIYEQPEVVGHTLAHYLDFAAGRTALPADFDVDFAARPAVDHRLRHRLLCRARRQILVRALRPPAGRHRYRLRVPLSRAAARGEGPVDRRLAVGRDGRHARLAALCQAEGQNVAAVVNVQTSTIAREVDFVLPTLAGPEIGVASTKAFTCAARRARGPRRRGRPGARHPRRADEERLVRAFSEVPRLMSLALHSRRQIERMARGIAARETSSISAAAPAFRSPSKAR